MTEFLLVVKKQRIIEDYIPNVEKLLRIAMDNTTTDEIRIKTTNVSGKIIDRLAAC